MSSPRSPCGTAPAPTARAPGRVRDRHGLQARCAAVYDRLAERAWLAPWAVVGPEGHRASLTRTAESWVADWLRIGSSADIGPGSSRGMPRWTWHLVSSWSTTTPRCEMLTIVLQARASRPRWSATAPRRCPRCASAPDLVLLDLMLPGMSGIDVCKAIRAESAVPVVMLTAKSDTVDVVLGLESGADDYVVKPFKPKELVARMRARLRRIEAEPAEQTHHRRLEIDVPGPPGQPRRRRRSR